MRTVQLDKNAGSKKFKNACNQEGLVRCILLPRGVREKSDAEVLDFGASNQYLTVSFDRGLFFDSGHVLVGRNPGGLLLRFDDDSIRQISTATAPKILKDFKAQFPEWHEAPWRNSILELTPSLVYVYKTTSFPLEFVELLSRGVIGWQTRLKTLLEANAQAGLPVSE